MPESLLFEKLVSDLRPHRGKECVHKILKLNIAEGQEKEADGFRFEGCQA